MNKSLRHDSETRELRLVYTDLWDGQHERTEYRLMSAREGGHALHGMAELDGKQVHGHAPDLYLKLGPWGERTVPVWTEAQAIGPTVKTPCPRAVNARRKCQQCQEGR